MPIGTPTSIGSVTNGAAPPTFTCSAAVAAGQVVIVAFGFINSVGQTVTISDSKTNAWNNDASLLSGNEGIVIASSTITNALTTSDTITATTSGSIANSLFCGAQVSGVGAKDQTLTATGSVVGWSVGPTGTTAQADELVMSACLGNAAGAETDTPGAGYTELFDFSTGASGVNLTLIYQIVSTTGTQTGSGTWTNSGSRVWSAAIATYKAVLAAAVPMSPVHLPFL